VVVRVDNITSTSSESSSAVTICWSTPRSGDVAKYELNVASADDVERRQIWIVVTDAERRRFCRQLDATFLRRGQLYHVFLRPWTARHRPGLSVVALFSLSGS